MTNTIRMANEMEQGDRLVVALVGVVGCAGMFWWENQSTTLKLGMSKQQVQALLGPSRQMMSQELNGMIVET